MKGLLLVILMLGGRAQAGVVGQIARVMAEVPVCSVLLSRDFKKRVALEKRPELLTAEHFETLLRQRLPIEAFAPNGLIYLDWEEQESSASRFQTDLARLNDLTMETPIEKSSYRWLYARLAILADGVEILNWEPTQTAFLDENGDTYVAPQALAKLASRHIEDVYQLEIPGLRRGLVAFDDHKQTRDLVIRQVPFYEFLNADGTLISNFKDKVIEKIVQAW